MKLFNIIIPAYNSVKTIEKTVNSLQNSGMTDFSIIIVNDGSSDNTESICKRLEYKYNYEVDDYLNFRFMWDVIG